MANKKVYKVLEVIWYYNNSFNQGYLGTFKSLKQARKFVKDNEKEWESDLKEYAETGLGVEIETWENDELVDSYTEWCKDLI